MKSRGELLTTRTTGGPHEPRGSGVRGGVRWAERITTTLRGVAHRRAAVQLAYDRSERKRSGKRPTDDCRRSRRNPCRVQHAGHGRSVMGGEMHRGQLCERLRFASAMPKSLAAFAPRALALCRASQFSTSSNLSAASSAEADQKQCALGSTGTCLRGRETVTVCE